MAFITENSKLETQNSKQMGQNSKLEIQNSKWGKIAHNFTKTVKTVECRCDGFVHPAEAGCK